MLIVYQPFCQEIIENSQKKIDFFIFWDKKSESFDDLHTKRLLNLRVDYNHIHLGGCERTSAMNPNAASFSFTPSAKAFTPATAPPPQPDFIPQYPPQYQQQYLPMMVPPGPGGVPYGQHPGFVPGAAAYAGPGEQLPPAPMSPGWQQHAAEMGGEFSAEELAEIEALEAYEAEQQMMAVAGAA